MISDPRPQKRYRATKEQWEAIRAWFSEDRCWVCDEPWTELHHIVNRSHAGDDIAENLAPLCSECHRLIEARDTSARSLLRHALLPSNYQYLFDKLGGTFEGWLERHYPVRAAA